MSVKQFLWSESYRPRTVNECILPASIKATASSFVAEGDLPHMILAGTPGIGKTTLALAMCEELGATTLFINASDENGIDVLRTKIKDFAMALSFDGKRRYVILDEADYLNAHSTQPALRGMMDDYASNCGFILTCNYPNRIIAPLHSRCTSISLAIPADEKKKLMIQTADRLIHILTSEQITYDDALVVQIVKRWWPDVRRMVNEMQRSCVDGVLTPAVMGQQADVQYESLFKAIRGKNYREARQWIGTYGDIDAPKFYRTVFEWLHEYAVESTLPGLIVITDNFQTSHVNSIDAHVHLAAYCLELMHNGQYK
jgi:replication-associated recombination protein RarA